MSIRQPRLTKYNHLNNKPMGVATYTTTTDMPDELRKTLPDIEELKKLL